MGRERNRSWKRLYLSVACMIFLSLHGCVTLKEIEKRIESRERLIVAQELLDQGDYEGSLKKNQEALCLCGDVPPGDKALFNLGLIYAHQEYPQRGYRKALDCFRRLVQVFPQSPFAGQAKIWIGILEENERMVRETEEAKMSIETLQTENERLKNEIEELDRMMKAENERLKSEIEELNKIIKTERQVDIEIDEKKKDISK